MAFIKDVLNNIPGTLLLIGIFPVLLAIIGSIKTKWFEINLSRWQRIAILALGVFLIGFGLLLMLTALKEPPEPAKQNWIALRGIEAADKSLQSNQVRLIISVNDEVSYSLPSNRLFATFQGGMEGERFPLPIGNTWNIRVKVLVLSRDKPNELNVLETQDPVIVNQKTLDQGNWNRRLYLVAGTGIPDTNYYVSLSFL